MCTVKAARIYIRFATLVLYEILQSDPAPENLLHYSSGRVELPYEKHMFQCTKANLGLSEELFVLGYHLLMCGCVSAQVFLWLCGQILGQNFCCKDIFVDPHNVREMF